MILGPGVNPSGKLSEIFPLKPRTDLDYPGDGYKVCYDEKWAVGYRYYDRHPDEVWYPFGQICLICDGLIVQKIKIFIIIKLH